MGWVANFLQMIESIERSGIRDGRLGRGKVMVSGNFLVWFCIWPFHLAKAAGNMG
jgi:hypothetical protein